MHDDLDFEPETSTAPDYRATVVDGRLTIVNWWPGMPRGGPMRALLDERAQAGVTIADLTVSGEPPAREVVVDVLARGDLRRAERALVGWAAVTGHRRIWFPDRLVELGATEVVAGTAATTCSNCGAEWRDGDHCFWVDVRSEGQFPNICPLCGGDLPQWRIRRRRPPARPARSARASGPAAGRTDS